MEFIAAVEAMKCGAVSFVGIGTVGAAPSRSTVTGTVVVGLNFYFKDLFALDIALYRRAFAQGAL